MSTIRTDNLQTAQEFDVFTCSLDGVTQIEASAGTGKTWNICALYVRLLLEKALSVEQILVVTFTKAATAELYERIRARLVLLVYVLKGGEAKDEPFVTRLLETTVGTVVSADEARLRLERALHSFDQAAIHTIHGFCQRALQEAPFAAALPFEFDWVTQEEALRFALAAEFWQMQIEPVAAADLDFANWLADKGAGPAALDAELKRYLQKPLAHLVFDGLSQNMLPAQVLTDSPGAANRALTKLFAQARALWQAQHHALAQLMESALSSLKATSYKPATLTLAFAAWQRYFEQDDAQAALADKAELLTASILEARVKKGCVAPTHPFFELADTLLTSMAAVQAEHTGRWLALLKNWLSWAPAALREIKQTRRVMSFDDLLTNLQSSLVAQPWLAQALKRRYPAALIDEFQDTDPLQFDIFNRIFAPHGPLFLVGDPKQAIYSFRAADLHTYLAARTQAHARYTLATNQRSTASLIAACNRLFSRNPAAFILDGLTYQAVRAGKDKQVPFNDAENPTAADLHIWMLPHDEQILSRNEALKRTARACAAEIVRLLALPTAQPAALDAEGHGVAATLESTKSQAGLNPRDIAVIVQTHRQGSLIKQALAHVGIGSVEIAQNSIFSTPEAQDLECVLRAIDIPSDARRLRGALTVDWFGVEASTLSQSDGEQDFPISRNHAEKNSPNAHDPAFWAERFTHYRWLWQTRGFAVMWRTLNNELRLAQRLAAGPNGERRLADLAHLAELMQAQAALQPSSAATLRWLSAQRTSKPCDDEMQVRLESDRNLVQIVTIHKSKGLEYAVVFCPFLYDAAPRKATSSALPVAYEYHDASDARAILHYGGAEADMVQIKEMVKLEQQAEKARLIYVALTRAVYRCYVVAGLYTSGSSTSTKGARGSMLNWLVAGAGYEFPAWLAKPPSEEEINATWQALADTTIKVQPLPVALSARLPERAQKIDAIPHARQAHRFLRESWQTASFTSLTTQSGVAREIASSLETLADYDALSQAMNTMPATKLSATLGVQPIPTERAADDILNFPRGAEAGGCLHRLFELVDFAQPSTWPAAIERALREYPVLTPTSPQSLSAMMMHLLHELALTELTLLAPGLTLASIDPARQQTELEFTFPASGELTAVRQLLIRHGYPDIALQSNVLRGYLKGFIDLVFEYKGRFWIVDWKSHYLGDTATDYEHIALGEAMAAHGYHLQALIYTLALHRYLRTRLPDYDYATHFGGYLYLFVRGVRPAWRTEKGAAGVYADVPDFKLIDEFDQLLQESSITS